MPLKHLRVCDHCDKVRYAGCSITCRVPVDEIPDSWVPNMQFGAGTLLREVVE